MKRARLLLFAAVLAIIPVSARAASTEDEAGDISEVDKDALGPLRERIPPVTGQVLLKRHRFELSPSVTLSIKDAFFSKYFFGLSGTYHFSEQFALSGRFAYAPFKTISGAAEICTPTSAASTSVGCRAPTYDELNGQAPGQMIMVASLNAQWAPIYGKLSLISSTFVHFDLYAVAGPAFIQYKGPSANGIGSSLTSTYGGDVGIGARFFFNRWVTLRTELRDLIYNENVVPLPSTALRQQIVFELGLSFFLPATFSGANP